MGKRETEKLIEMPIPKLLLSICSQTTLSVMLFSVYSLMDTFFVARGVGAYAAGAVSLSAPVVQVIGAFASMVGAGGASIISRALGKGDVEKAAATAANTFALFWGSALLFSIAGLFCLDYLMKLLAADGALLPYARGYTRIILFGAVTATGFSSLIRAEGNIRYSIYQWAIPSLVNLALDPLFIFAFRWGVEGAALSTVIAQLVSTGMSMYYFFLSKWHFYPIRRRHFHIRPAVMGEVLLIGSPTLLTQLCSSAYMVAVNHRIDALGGAAALSAFGIISRLRSFLEMPISGIVQGLQPIVSFNHAAGRPDRVREAMRVVVFATIGYGAAVLLLCELLPAQLMRVFIEDARIVSVGVSALRPIALSLPFVGALTVTAAFFQSIGKARVAFALPIISVLLVSLPALYILSGCFALTGIWYANPVSEGIKFLISIAFLRHFINRQNKKGAVAV